MKNEKIEQKENETLLKIEADASGDIEVVEVELKKKKKKDDDGDGYCTCGYEATIRGIEKTDVRRGQRIWGKVNELKSLFAKGLSELTLEELELYEHELKAMVAEIRTEVQNKKQA